ncbi:MAG: hypothetical protein NUV54_00310 [Candidatus Taylorbacteria bacterium]|nr:hypothetical protein [Candidatus Taylorbacteria bacterium]
MGDYKRSGGFGDKRGGGGSDRRSHFGGKPSFRGGGRDGERKEMFDATCGECHKPCQVPFRPTGERPVFCRDCFQGQRDGGGNSFAPREERRPDARGGDRFPRREFSAPSSYKPQASGDTRQIEQLKRELESINVKLDKIMQSMLGGTPAVSAKKEKVVADTSNGTLKEVVEKVISPAEPAKKEKKKARSKKK